MKAFGALLSVIVVMGALLFIPAGTIDYWQAWAFLGVYGGIGSATVVYLMKKDPRLLERRMSGGPIAEKETSQKLVMSIVSSGFVATLVISALDRRSHWSTVPAYEAIAGEILIVLGWVIIFFVLNENSFASATIRLADDQKVISTGPYAVLRHPMYGGGLLYMLGMPIALGSWWGLLGVMLMLPALIWRLFDEENFLKRNLPGYVEYCEKVRFRIIPSLW